MRNNFLSGLIILLPVVLTIAIFMFFINLLTQPFLGLVESAFKELGLLDRFFLFLSGQQIVHLTSKLLVMATLALTTLFIGFLAKHFFLDELMEGIDRFIHRIPFVNKIYKAFQDVMSTIFTDKNTSFSQVVLVPYPHADTYSIGFITKDELPKGSDNPKLISVFVPGTPNPTIGFSLLYTKEELIFLEMKVEEALKFIISCGVNFSEFKVKA